MSKADELALARSWAARGLLPRESLLQLEREAAMSPQGGVQPPPVALSDAAPSEGTDGSHGALAKEGPTTGTGLSILYGLAGVLVGAATVTLVLLQHLGYEDSLQERLLFMIQGLALGAAALALWWFRKWPAIADVLLVASLVPLTAMGHPGSHDGTDRLVMRILSPMALLCAAGAIWIPRVSWSVPIAATLAYFAASGMMAFAFFENDTGFLPLPDEYGYLVWCILTGMMLAALVAIDWKPRKNAETATPSSVAAQKRPATPRPWRVPAAVLLTVGLVAPGALLLDASFSNLSSETEELVVGAAFLLVVGAGVLIQDRGLLLGGALVVAGDAIVFAFDVNRYLGVVTLVAVAVAIIALAAGLARKPKRRAAQP